MMLRSKGKRPSRAKGESLFRIPVPRGEGGAKKKWLKLGTEKKAGEKGGGRWEDTEGVPTKKGAVLEKEGREKPQVPPKN